MITRHYLFILASKYEKDSTQFSNLISILTSLLKISQSLHVAHGTISENTLCSNIDTCLFYGKPFLPSSVAAITDRFSFPFLLDVFYIISEKVKYCLLAGTYLNVNAYNAHCNLFSFYATQFQCDLFAIL